MTAEPTPRLVMLGSEDSPTCKVVLFIQEHEAASTPLKLKIRLQGKFVSPRRPLTVCPPSVGELKEASRRIPLSENTALSNVGGSGGAELLRIRTELELTAYIAALGPEGMSCTIQEPVEPLSKNVPRSWIPTDALVNVIDVGEALTNPPCTVGEIVTAISGGISSMNENTYILVGVDVPMYLLKSPVTRNTGLSHQICDINMSRWVNFAKNMRGRKIIEAYHRLSEGH